MKKLISGPGFNHLVEARHGYVLYNVNDRYIGRSVEHYGEWSPGETALFGQFCRPGHYVADVGAHIGTTRSPSRAWSPTGGGCSPSSRNGWWPKCWPPTSRSTA